MSADNERSMDSETEGTQTYQTHGYHERGALALM